MILQSGDAGGESIAMGKRLPSEKMGLKGSNARKTRSIGLGDTPTKGRDSGNNRVRKFTGDII